VTGSVGPGGGAVACRVLTGRDLVSVSGLWPRLKREREKLLDRDKFVIQFPPGSNCGLSSCQILN
jgi:hypothetical protein